MSDQSRATSRDRAGWGFSFRLGLVYSILFALGLLAVFWGTYLWMANSLTDREVAATRERLREYRAWYEEGGLTALRSRFQEASSTSSDVMFLRATGPGGQAMLFAAPRGGQRIGPRDLNDIRYDANLVRQKLNPIATSDNRWTVDAIRARDGVILQAGKSSQEIEQVLAEFRRTFTIIAVPAILLAILAGTFVGFRRLAPVRRLIETMRDILQTGDLQRRAPAVEPARNELNALGAMFNQLLDRNSQLISAMRDSLDAVAHDLRTPMTRLRNTAESALTGSTDPREALAACLEESDESLTLLRVLTEIAEAEAGTIKLHREDLLVADLLQRVVDTYEFVAEEKQITLEWRSEPGLIINADRTRLTQAISNLIDNAIKFSPDNTKVIAEAQPNKDGVEIIIADSGPGIPLQERERIFDRLYRGESSRSSRGMGLGLSLVKAIVEAHGGSVLVADRTEDLQGARFSVNLPQEV